MKARMNGDTMADQVRGVVSVKDLERKLMEEKSIISQKGNSFYYAPKDSNKLDGLMAKIADKHDAYCKPIQTKEGRLNYVVDIPGVAKITKDSINNRIIIEATTLKMEDIIISKAQRDASEIKKWYEDCINHPQNDLMRRVFEEKYKEISGEMKKDANYKTEIAASCSNLSNMSEDVAALSTVMYDLEKIRGVARDRDVKEFNELKKGLDNDFAKRIAVAAYGYDIVSKYDEILNDKEFLSAVKTYQKDAKQKGFDTVFLSLELRAQWNFLIEAKPALEKAGRWNTETLNTIARYFKYGLDPSVKNNYIDPAGHVEFFKYMLPTLCEYFPDKMDELMAACAVGDKKAREEGVDPSDQDRYVRKYYTKKSDKLKTVIGMEVQRIVEQLKRYPTEETNFSIIRATERIQREIAGAYRLSLNDFIWPFAYDSKVIDTLNYWDAERRFGRIPVEAIPEAFPPGRPAIDTAALFDATRILLDVSDLRERPIELPKRISEMTVQELEQHLERNGVPPVVARDFATEVKGDNASLYANWNKTYEGTNKWSVDAISRWYISRAKANFEDDVYASVYLDTINNRNDNLVTIYERDERNNTFKSRTFVRTNDRWIRGFYEENIPEDKAKKMFYGGYTDYTREIRVRTDENKLSGVVVGTKVTDKIALAAIADGKDITSAFKEANKATGVTYSLKNSKIRFKYYTVDNVNELASSYLVSGKKETELAVAEDKRVAAAYKQIYEKGYITTNYYKSVNEWASSFVGSMDKRSTEKGKLAAFIILTAIANDTGVSNDSILKEGAGGTIGIEFGAPGKTKLLQVSEYSPSLSTIKYKGNDVLLEGAKSEQLDLLNSYFRVYGPLGVSAGYKFTEGRTYRGGGASLRGDRALAYLHGSVIDAQPDFSGIGWFIGGKYVLHEQMGIIALTTGEKFSSVLKNEEDFNRNMGTWFKFASNKSAFFVVDEKEKKIDVYTDDEFTLRSGLSFYCYDKKGVYRADVFGESKKKVENSALVSDIRSLNLNLSYNKATGWGHSLEFKYGLERTKEETFWSVYAKYWMRF